MSIRLAGLLCAAALSLAQLSGCSITNCEEGAICLGDDGDELRYRCAKLCERLDECGELSSSRPSECVDTCIEAGEHDDTEDYCECVEETSCGRLERECGRPPFVIGPPSHEDDEPAPGCDAGAPPPKDAGPEPQHDAGVPPLADGGRDPEPDAGIQPRPDAGDPVCQIEDDCADSEGCRDGSCRPKCAASCQCGVGDVCDDGLCVPPPPATMTCENDCDCPAGDRCLDRVCVGT